VQAASRSILLLLVLCCAMPLFAQRHVSAGVQLEGRDRGNDYREVHASVQWPTRVGPLIGRVAHARWFGDGTQVEAELYPKLGPKVYAYTAVAVGSGDVFPDVRIGGELFAGFGKGWEASAGFRHLDFDADDVTVWTGSIAKYVGNWYAAVRVFETSSDGAVNVNVRRYSGDGREYVGIRAGEGRAEIRSGADLDVLSSREIVIESRFDVTGPWFAELRGGVGSSDRVIAGATLGRRF
jgi:YaiO family outer membrane protein